MKLSKAIEGYKIAKAADGMSSNTLTGYQTHFKQLIDFTGDIEIEKVKSQQLIDFMVFLRTKYRPKRMSKVEGVYTTSTIRNAWCATRSLFGWAALELGFDRPDLVLKMPKVSYPETVPFTQAEIQAMLKACRQPIPMSPSNRKSFNTRRPTSLRDRAILLLLLDTGIRVSECANLQRQDVNMETGEIYIRPVMSARKNKPRTLTLGSACRKALWSYLSRRDRSFPDDPLFLSKDNQKMTRNGIRLLVKSLAKVAGVENAYPHRFRHTFAIQFLRNGGDVFALQHALGHSDWTMTRHYSNLALSDFADAHRRASPADNWRL